MIDIEYMKKLRRDIKLAVSNARKECLANSDNEYHCPLGKKCPFKDPNDHIMSCNIDGIRLVLERKHIREEKDFHEMVEKISDG